MIVAKVLFGYGKLTFNKGQQVPEEIAAKYPHLVEESEKEVVAKKVEEYTHEGTTKISTGKRNKK